MGKKGMIGLVLGIVVVVLVAMGLFMNGWVTGYVQYTLTDKVDVSYGLWGFTNTADGETESFSYSDDDMKDTEIAKAVGTPRMLILVGLILMILMIVLGFLAMQGKMPGKLALLLGILGGLLLLIGALWAVGSMKSALQTDLEGAGYELGNGSMFFITLLAAIMAFVAGAMVKSLGKAKEPAAMPPPPAMAPGQPPAY